MKIRKYKRAIVVFLLLNLLNSVIMPSLIYGSQNPSAEEYNSFAPSQTNEMVDTRTGDFHYDVPLFDVPGPEGGYPIHAFYQSGIKPGQDASWVGLGWNLNAGAITRQVKDIPDDFSGETYSCSDAMSVSAVDQSYPSARQVAYEMAKEDLGNPLFQPFKPSSNITLYGVLHAHDANNLNVPSVSFDCHALYSEDSISYYDNPEMLKGGSLPSYDEYMVTGEGIAGEIEPMILENGTLFRSSITGALSPTSYGGARSYKTIRSFWQPKQYFRFKKEFSNSFTTSTVNPYYFSNHVASLDFGSNVLAYNYTLPDANGFNFNIMRLAGGKHVDYFTNSEITAGTAKTSGFIDYPYYVLNNSDRSSITYLSTNYDVSKRVGGFSITKEDGTTYHYALPVYTYQNITNKTVVTESGITVSRTSTNASPYAYSWLLTTITGSDFIDKNNNGYADEEDWGKWINFNYGKATSGYFFRDPYSTSSGFYEYTMSGTQLSNSGYKELYYLDAIYTRSHCALFSKAYRSDAIDANNNNLLALKLNSAILMSNDGIKNISNGMGWTYANLYTSIQNIKGANSSYNTNAITIEDINTISGTTATNYAAQILKESKFTYDNSLCAGAPNGSKLTLNSVRTFGRNNSPLEPSTEFSYELSNPASTTIMITDCNTTVDSPNRNGSISVTNNVFAEGDILKFTISSTTYYCTLLKETSSTTYNVLFLGPTVPFNLINSSGTAYQTKNPPFTQFLPTRGVFYCGVFADQWGYFKSDMTFDQNSIRDLQTSYISSKAVDCWSLRKITTKLGGTIEINYESDSYYGFQMTEGEIFNLNSNFRYTNATTHSLSTIDTSYCTYENIDHSTTSGVFEFTIKEDITGKFQVGQTVEIATIGTFTNSSYNYYSIPVTSVYGKDSFTITSVDATGRKIQGKFVDPTSGTKTNPFFTGSDPYAQSIFFHDNSFVIQKNPFVGYGGGVRVSSITVKEGNGEVYSTNYSYNSRYNGLTSGSIPCEPMLQNRLRINYADGWHHYTDPAYPGVAFYDSDMGINNMGTYNAQFYESLLTSYELANNDLIGKAIANTDFISPYLIYEFVTVSHIGNGNTHIKSEEFNYQPYYWNCIQRIKENQCSDPSVGPSSIPEVAVKLTIQDYSSSIGQLLNYSEYDASGNMVSQTNYSYTSSPPLNQGRLDEVFHEERWPDYGTNDNFSNRRYVALVTVRSEYPSAISRITTTDNLKNFTSFKDFYKFDLYSGNPTETVTKNSQGDYFKQKQVPAYTKSQYGGMGLKFSSATNRNILSPITATYTYKVNPSDYSSVISTLSASVNTWNNIWTVRAFDNTNSIYYDNSIATDNTNTVQDDRIWRAQCSYVWKSTLLNTDGSYSNFVDFNWGGSPDQHWQRVNCITRYDQFSNPTEKVNINGNYATTKYGYDLTYPLTGADNANYNELSYSGAEDINSSSVYGSTAYLGSEVATGGSGSERLDNTIAHSGSSSLKLTQNQWGLIYMSPIGTGAVALNKSYRASVWIYDNGNTSANLYYMVKDASFNYVTSGSVNTISMPNPVTVGKWKQLTLDFTLTGSYSGYYIAIGCNNPSATPAWFDDLRFHPLSETITSYVYDKPSGQVTYSLDNNNFYSKRVYDNMFRPSSDYKETIYGEMKTKEYQYNYGKGQ